MGGGWPPSVLRYRAPRARGDKEWQQNEVTKRTDVRGKEGAPPDRIESSGRARIPSILVDARAKWKKEHWNGRRAEKPAGRRAEVNDESKRKSDGGP